MAYTSDVETRLHSQESIHLHKTLCGLPGSRGSELSEFIANTALHATGACIPTAMENVIETTKTLMTLLNRQGPKSIGFWKDGKLPKFMCVLDLFGKHCGFFADGPALIRELCASFYGPVDCGFGNASLMRHEIDSMSKQADAMGTSLLLVLSAPWGCALGDRFWRLCTVRECQGTQTQYVDSERVLCSMQRPPARVGSSVLGQGLELATSEASVAAMLQEWRAIDVHASEAPDASDASDTSHTSGADAPTEGASAADKRMVAVMSNVIKTLREQNREQQARITELETSQQEDIDRRISEAVQKERQVWKVDVESLNLAMERQANEVDYERVRVDAMKAELVGIDYGFIPSVQKQTAAFESALSTLRGKLLVMEDELKTCKTKLSESRKRDNDSRKERSQFEAMMESRSGELSALRAELEEGRQKASGAKRTASEHVAQLLDKNVEAGRQIEQLKEEVSRLTTSVEEARSERAVVESKEAGMLQQMKEAKACVKWLLAIRVARQMRPVPACAEAEASVEDRGETEKESTSTSLEVEAVAASEGVDRDYLLNLVASAKGLVAHIGSFVDKVQNTSTDSPAKWVSPIQSITATPETQQQRDENCYGNTEFYLYDPARDTHAMQFVPVPYPAYPPPQQFAMQSHLANHQYQHAHCSYQHQHQHRNRVPMQPPRPPPAHTRVRKK
jgi:hypothetical protein